MIEERHHRLNAESDTPSEDSDVEFEKVEKKLKLTKMKLELRRAEEELKALDAGGAPAVSGTAAGAIPLFCWRDQTTRSQARSWQSGQLQA